MRQPTLVTLVLSAHAIAAATAFATSHHRAGVVLCGLAGAILLADRYARHLRDRTVAELQMLGWALATTAVLAAAVLMTVGVLGGSTFETALLYVAAAGGATAVVGARKLM